MTNEKRDSNLLSRRLLLQTTGTAVLGTSGIAASATESTKTASGRSGATFHTITQVDTADVQFNPRNETHRSPAIEAFLFDPLAEYDPQRDAFVPGIADRWEFSTAGGDEYLDITLRDDYTWHDGTPIDATDLRRQLKLDRVAGKDYWDVVSTVTTPGDYTVRIRFAGEINESVLEFDILQRRLNHPPTHFDVDGDGYETLVIGPDEAVGSGPFEITDVTDDTVVLSLVDDHPNKTMIERAGISNVVFESYPSESEQYAALADGELSGTGESYYPTPFRRFEGATPVESLAELTAPSDAGWGILLNHTHPLLEDRRVRKAIAHVFSSVEAVESMTDTIPRAIELQTGLAPEKTKTYLEGELGRFETYGDQKRAAELLGRAGFERTWEQWLDPRGEPATFGFLGGGTPHADDGTCLAPTEPAWFYGARAFVDQLEAFLRNEEGGATPVVEAAMEQGLVGVGPHDDVFAFLPARQWGHFDGAHPYHNYRSDLLLREAAHLGYGPTVEVPPYDDPTGPAETVDIRELLDDLRRASTESEERRLVRELAWIVNETVPYLQGYYRPAVAYVDESAWRVEDGDRYSTTARATRSGALRPIGRGTMNN